jgi:hypothetical protein
LGSTSALAIWRKEKLRGADEAAGQSFGSGVAMIGSKASVDRRRAESKANHTKRIAFHMKATGKTGRAGRASQTALTMAITSLVVLVWVYFGRLYLIHDPGEWQIGSQQLGYPLYIIPLIGVTHILGGVGLLVPNAPRLTGWVYAGLVINLLFAFYSQLGSGGSTWDKFNPVLVMVLAFASYALRGRMPAHR